MTEFSQIAEERRGASMRPIAVVALEPEEFSKRFSIRFEPGASNLGESLAALVETGQGHQYLLQKYLESPAAGVEVLAPEHSNAGVDLRRFLDAFDLEPDIVTWSLQPPVPGTGETSGGSGSHIASPERGDQMKQGRLEVAQPVYFLLDTSGSMSGEAFRAVNEGLRSTLGDLQSDRRGKSVWLAVITLGQTPEVVLPLTRLSDVPSIKPLTQKGRTSFGPAFALLRHSIQEDWARMASRGITPRPPTVLFLTDGRPTDSGWEAELAALTDPGNPTRPQITAVKVGPGKLQFPSRFEPAISFYTSRDLKEAFREVVAGPADHHVYSLHKRKLK